LGLGFLARFGKFRVVFLGRFWRFSRFLGLGFLAWFLVFRGVFRSNFSLDFGVVFRGRRLARFANFAALVGRSFVAFWLAQGESGSQWFWLVWARFFYPQAGRFGRFETPFLDRLAGPLGRFRLGKTGRFFVF
jgi:hypothetical protein